MAAFPKPEDVDRTFKEIEVTAFRFQSQADRFPSINGTRAVPRVAQWRMNLTALSQEHNLYFAAIGSEIHITEPRNTRQTIPGTPDVFIRLPTTEQSLRVNGHIDSQNSHDVNHLIVGKLGEFEIVLVCCDDGDVLAFYTHAIKAAMENYNTELLFTGRYKQGPTSHSAWEERLDSCWGSNLQPMFHQNVGISAWGLAIHQQSRLIAVSSNYHEITTFAFALHYKTDSSSDSKLSDIRTSEEFSSPMPPDDSPNERDYSWKKVIRLDARGHNVPTLAFASSRDGEAEVLLAADILGNLWKLDVGLAQLEVNELEPMRRVYDAEEDLGGHDMMGWGILVLPLSQFKPQSTARSALGVFELDTIDNDHHFYFDSSKEFYINISESLYDIRDPSVKDATKHQGSYMSYIEDGVEEYTLEWNPALTHPIVNMASVLSQQFRALSSIPDSIVARKLREFPVENSILDQRTTKAFHLLLNVSIPGLEFGGITCWSVVEKFVETHDEVLFTDDSSRSCFIERPLPSGLERARKAWEKFSAFATERPKILPIPLPIHGVNGQFHLPDGSAILRTYMNDVELLPPTHPIPHTVFKNILFHPNRGEYPLNVFQQNRLNMLASIPELNLVVVASQKGDAALLTLTRMEHGFSIFGPVCTFRLDCVVPFQQHIPVERSALMGMATSRVWTGGGGVGEYDTTTNPRWRLLLHYMDQSILSYELWRNEGGDMVVV